MLQSPLAHLNRDASDQAPEQEQVINVVIELNWETKSTRLKPFEHTIPLPLFPSKSQHVG